VRREIKQFEGLVERSREELRRISQGLGGTLVFCDLAGNEYASDSAASTEAERDEAAEIIRKGRQAERRFAYSNLRLVASNVRTMMGKFGTKTLPWEDMIQEGDLGLLKAIEKFDYRKGFRFSTYATYWIRQQIRIAILNKAGLIRVPVNRAYDISRIKRAINDMNTDLQRQPTLEELSEVLGIKVDKIQKHMEFLGPNYANPCSLDEPAHSREDPGRRTRGDMIRASAEDEPWFMVENEWEKEEVVRLMQRLTDEERSVVQMRFGIGGFPPSNLAAVARTLGLGYNRTTNVLKRALRIMKDAHVEYHGWADRHPQGKSVPRSYADPDLRPILVIGPTEEIDPLSNEERKPKAGMPQVLVPRTPLMAFGPVWPTGQA
jgi:RNA polymerase primary sigma factor